MVTNLKVFLYCCIVHCSFIIYLTSILFLVCCQNKVFSYPPIDIRLMISITVHVYVGEVGPRPQPRAADPEAGGGGGGGGGGRRAHRESQYWLRRRQLQWTQQLCDAAHPVSETSASRPPGSPTYRYTNIISNISNTWNWLLYLAAFYTYIKKVLIFFKSIFATFYV